MCNSLSWVFFRHHASLCPLTITAGVCTCDTCLPPSRPHTHTHTHACTLTQACPPDPSSPLPALTHFRTRFMANVRAGVVAVESGKPGTTYTESWLAKEQDMAAAWVEKWGKVDSRAVVIACMVPSSMCGCVCATHRHSSGPPLPTHRHSFGPPLPSRCPSPFSLPYICSGAGFPERQAATD